MVVKIGLKNGESRDNDEIIKELKDRFRSRIRVAPRIEILPIEEIRRINYPEKSRKPIKFIDLRQKNG